jgi:hypothetical protein
MFSALNIKLHDFKNDLNTKGHGTGSCLFKAKKYLATVGNKHYLIVLWLLGLFHFWLEKMLLPF